MASKKREFYSKMERPTNQQRSRTRNLPKILLCHLHYIQPSLRLSIQLPLRLSIQQNHRQSHLLNHRQNLPPKAPLYQSSQRYLFLQVKLMNPLKSLQRSQRNVLRPTSLLSAKPRNPDPPKVENQRWTNKGRPTKKCSISQTKDMVGGVQAPPEHHTSIPKWITYLSALRQGCPELELGLFWQL